ncbi:MAG: hypothetical protein AAFZ80_10420 [Cyanobacteria bacterium P01_A01_bin.105]
MQANVSQPSPSSNPQGNPALASSSSMRPPQTAQRGGHKGRHSRSAAANVTPAAAAQSGNVAGFLRQLSGSQSAGPTSAGPTSPPASQKAKQAASPQRYQQWLAVLGLNGRKRQPQAAQKSSPQPPSPQASSPKPAAKQAPKPAAKPPKPKRIDLLFKGDAPDNIPASKPSNPAETLLGSRLLFELVLVRPWILVCGFWLLLVGTSALALSGLADPGKPAVSEAPTSGEVQPLQPLGVAPDTAVTSRLSESPIALNGGRTPDPAVQPLPMWSLWVMVGACAAGCIVLSRPGLITFGTPDQRRRPLRSRPLGSRPPRSRKTEGKSDRSAALTARPRAQLGQGYPAPHQRPQLNPNYPQGQVMAVSNQGAIRQVTPTHAAQPTPTKLVSFDVGPAKVSVIPDHESHALDWKEGSLAHKLDVRQNRPLKSFL